MRIRKRVREKFLAEFVYGAIDGTITTFAIVAGSVGALFPPIVILVLGFANLFADGFSMGASSYLSHRSQKDLDGPIRRSSKKKPIQAAIATFFAFVIVGIIPLLAYVVAPFIRIVEDNTFLFASILTGVAFIIIGIAKGTITRTSKTGSAFETLVIGGLAAFIAYFVAAFLRGLVG